REDFNNDKVDAGEIGAGHAVTAIYEITPVGGKRMVDPLRYGAEEKAAPMPVGNKEEFAFLKIRYKLPQSDSSTLMTTPITISHEAKSVDGVSPDVRFAAAVAAFGQM